MMLNISEMKLIKNLRVKMFFMMFSAHSEKKLTLLQKEEINFYPAITANRSNATIFVILIIGFTAGPAVSLYGSPTVSPVTAAL